MAELKLRCSTCGNWFKAKDYQTTTCKSCQEKARALAAKAIVVSARGVTLARSYPPTNRVSPPLVSSTVDVEPVALPESPATISHATDLLVEVTAVEPHQAPAATEPGAHQPAAVDPVAPPEGSTVDVAATVTSTAAPTQVPRGNVAWLKVHHVNITDEEFGQIRDMYLKVLPLPPIGIHKEFAKSLGMPNLKVYRTIRRIRSVLELPTYNERSQTPQ